MCYKEKKQLNWQLAAKLVVGAIAIMAIFCLLTAKAGAETKTQYVMVPNTIGGYDTIQLLQYLAVLRQENVAIDMVAPAKVPVVLMTKDELYATYEYQHVKPTCRLSMSVTNLNSCKASVKSYDAAENAWVSAQPHQ